MIVTVAAALRPSHRILLHGVALIAVAMPTAHRCAADEGDESPAAANATAARQLMERAVQAAAAQPPVSSPAPAATPPANEPPDVALAKLSATVAAKQLEARRAAQRDPAEAMAILDRLTAEIDRASISAETKGQFKRRIDRGRRDIEEATGKRAGELALDRRNAAIESKIDRERAKRVEVDERLAMLVEEYNSLVDEQRFAEAEVVAKKAGQLAPDNPVVRQLLAQSRMARRLSTQRSIEQDKQSGFIDVAEDVEQTSSPFVGPIEFPTTKDWKDLTKNRSQLQAEGRSQLTAAEMAISRKLATPVKASHRNQPLAAVLDALAKQADVPIHIDMVGLESEAVRSDTPVTISLDQPISLKSALRLLLEPLHLDYVVKDDVLKVTSPKLVKGEIYSITYPVADLVIPIPNFSSDGLGITGALRDGYSRISPRNALAVQVGPAPAGINGVTATPGDAAVSPASLAQFQAPGMNNNPPAMGSNPSIPFGPPTVGGGQADFQSLIDLIQQTVEPTTWNTVGGNGAIQPFNTNLSIVVSQTQEVHEKIADLLEQLRRLQDLQVTIEVRFITLNDAFFERIGVDFDFNIQSTTRQPLNMTAVPTNQNGSALPAGIATAPGGQSQVIGLDNQGNVGVQAPAYFSVPFRQNSFAQALPPANIPSIAPYVSQQALAANAANFGFAILSDIEAYFLIQAAQGNVRSNVMQAPKVTLFNGQNAFVSDTRQQPFVTSVVPVVGDFAAAQQPVITVLSEGTAVNVQAVVSSDRRFVRLTLVPFFSQIGKVDTFQFEGTRSTKSKSSDEKSGLEGDVDGDRDALNAGITAQQRNSNELEVNSSGTTLQLPQFLFTTVTTTVSVPDGGTVLLGGVKRLREGRNEFGVPILSKVPYINRLFRNVAIGRSTDSLMLMVTPRIIIQEEEEEKLLGSGTP